MKRKIGVTVIVVLMSATPVAWGQLSLTVIPEKTEYVVQEPVKLMLVFRNESTEYLRTFNEEYLGQQMEYTRYEVEYPDGHVETRHHEEVEIFSWVFPDKYLGQRLPPGDSIVAFTYPDITRDVDPSLPPGEGGYEPTFGAPGVYGIRVVYEVEEGFVHLWKPVGGRLVSNTAYLRFREPDAAEREIIDALWAGGMGPFHGDTGQFSGCWPYDEARLRDVIRRYPGHPLIVHARLALAKTLQCKLDSDPAADLEEARGILESLIAEHPRFRPAEVRILFGQTARWQRRYESAAAHLAEGLRQMPYLAKNYVYMRTKLKVDDSRIGDPNDAFGQWRRSRREGVPWKPEELKRDD